MANFRKRFANFASKRLMELRPTLWVADRVGVPLSNAFNGLTDKPDLSALAESKAFYCRLANLIACAVTRVRWRHG